LRSALCACGFCLFVFFFFLPPSGPSCLYPRRTQQWLGLVLRVCVFVCVCVFLFLFLKMFF
jgi:hypothetical protein